MTARLFKILFGRLESHICYISTHKRYNMEDRVMTETERITCAATCFHENKKKE